jgi:fatty-acyl-CoA synthase
LNIGEWISKRAIVHPEKPFLTDKDKAYNNRQFNERVNKTANALTDFGVMKGDRVALLMSNCSEFLEVVFGCAKIGAIVVPLNFRLATAELVYIIKDCEPGILIYSDEFTTKIKEIKAADTGVQKYFRQGSEGTTEDAPFADYVSRYTADEPKIIAAADLKDPLFILYTSGTTGDPKGAVLTHQNILFGAIHSLLGYGVDRSYKSLVVAPLFHIAA